MTPYDLKCFQFFGRVQRAWVSDGSLLKFESVESFQKKAEEIKKATGSYKKKYLKAFNPSSSGRPHWNEALNSKFKLSAFLKTNMIFLLSAKQKI